MGTTKQWFEAAVPNPTDKNFQVQLGVHFEEISEMLEALTGDTEQTSKRLEDLAADLSVLGNQLKTGRVSALVRSHEEFLDALVDQRVTATGVGHMLGYDMEGADKEVDRSNFSKFVDGKPIFDINGKIMKGPDYTAPELFKFTGR